MPILLLLVLLALAVPPAAGAAPRVLVTGDSMVRPLDRQLIRPVERAGGRLKRDTRPGTNLSRPLAFDWVRHARRQMKRYRPDATVMFIGAGDSYPLKAEDGREVECCSRSWIAAYARRVGRLMSIYRRDGRANVYWLTLPAARNRDHARRIAAVNAGITAAAEEAAEGVRVVDTVPVLSPGYRFKRRIRYKGRRVVIRDDDGVHLTVGGARVARDLVVRAMRRDGVLPR